jgi:hypothetical protein
MRAKDCIQCKHFRFGKAADRRPRHGVFRTDTWAWWACLRDHRPRFYWLSFGWRRRCNDFARMVDR